MIQWVFLYEKIVKWTLKSISRVHVTSELVNRKYAYSVTSLVSFVKFWTSIGKGNQSRLDNSRFSGFHLRKMFHEKRRRTETAVVKK